MKKTIIYAAVAAVLVLTFVLQEVTGGSKNTVSIPALPENIDKIVFESEKEALELYGNPSDSAAAQNAAAETTDEENYSGWRVGSEAFPADGQKVADLVTAAAFLGRADVISTREGYKKFGLTMDNERILRFFAGDEEVLTLRFGNNTSSGASVYARVEDQREVVLLPQELSRQFSTDVSDFREKRIASFPRDSIDHIEITSPGHEKILLTRDPADDDDDIGEIKWTLGSAGGEVEEIDEGRIRDLFTELAELRAGSFPDEDPKGEPFADLVIARNGGERAVVSLWPPDGEENYPVRVSTNRYSFTVPKWRARRLLLGMDRYFEKFEKDEE